MSERSRRVQADIDNGDVATLLAYVRYGPCACRGPEGDEPLCRCKMSDLQVRRAVSFAALRRGRLLRLAKPETGGE